MMALRVGIAGVRGGDPRDFFQGGPVCEHRRPQLGPVGPAAARDHIVDGGEREPFVVEVAVTHGARSAHRVKARVRFGGRLKSVGRPEPGGLAVDLGA